MPPVDCLWRGVACTPVLPNTDCTRPPWGERGAENPSPPGACGNNCGIPPCTPPGMGVGALPPVMGWGIGIMPPRGLEPCPPKLTAPAFIPCWEGPLIPPSGDCVLAFWVGFWEPVPSRYRMMPSVSARSPAMSAGSWGVVVGDFGPTAFPINPPTMGAAAAAIGAIGIGLLPFLAEQTQPYHIDPAVIPPVHAVHPRAK